MSLLLSQITGSGTQPNVNTIAATAMMAAVQAWNQQPPPPPQLPPQIAAIAPAPPVQVQVPVGSRIPQAVLSAWLPPDPLPQQFGRSPPFTPSGPAPQNPPFAGGAKIPDAVNVWWIPPPPQPPVAKNLNPPIAGPPVQNPPFMGGAKVPREVLVDWIPPPPQPPVAINLQPKLLTSDPSFAGGAVVPQTVLLNHDWAPRWPWARTPVITPSGPAATNPPFPGTRIGVDVQNAWLPPQPQPIVGQQLFQGTTTAVVYVPPSRSGQVETAVSWLPIVPPPPPSVTIAPFLSSPAAVLRPPRLDSLWPWWEPKPWLILSAPSQAFQTPPPPSNAYRIPRAVLSWWELPPPAPIVAKNLNPPIQGPVGVLVDGASVVHGTGIVSWTAHGGRYELESLSGLYLLEDSSGDYLLEQVNIQAAAAQVSGSGQSKGDHPTDPNFITYPNVRVSITRPLLLRRITLTYPGVRRSVTSALRRQVTYGNARVTVTMPRRPGMPQGNDFSAVDPTETVTNTWDFGPWMKTGTTISVVQTTFCSLRSGTDASPGSRLIGTAQLATSPTTGAANQAVTQQVQGMQAGARYILLCTVQFSDSQVMTLWAHQDCVAPS